MTRRVLITGGAGYIGSHSCVSFLEAGYDITVIDNLCNSSPEALRRVQEITGRTLNFVVGDVRDRPILDRLLTETAIDAVIHFAGLKAVGESVAEPLKYYDNNVVGTIVLLEAMQAARVKKLVFSSSATVYGDPDAVPIPESATLRATNPYGRSKLMICDMLRDLYRADGDWRISLLRYFNPVGAHASGLIGEDPAGIPNNLVPYIAQVAAGQREFLPVFGDDYPTPDGTGVRDFIHVVDLAEGHVRALQHIETTPGLWALNLGTGRGYSVREMIAAFEQACGRRIANRVVPRRPGDIATCYADPSLAEQTIGWRAKRGIEQMCADHWRWQQKNPRGYKV